jgi:hypothetical protein
MCYVWVSEQTAIISLYSIYCLVFVTEMVWVYCAVRNLITYNVYEPLKPSGHYMYHQD